MERTLEAILSRQNMSTYKTVYVEGDIDKQIIEDFLENKQIQNIRIYRIEADNEQICYGSYCRDNKLGAKQQIISFITHSNNDNTIDRNKYLGIVDADLDYCFNEIQNIDSLVYTDMNSMESYFIDIDIFKKICDMYKIEDTKFEYFKNHFNQYTNNFIEFNICFITQVKCLNNFQENTISFDDIPYGQQFIDNSFQFNIENFKYKAKQDKEEWYSTYLSLKANFEDLKISCSDNIQILKFLHGKYFLKYLIYILKTIFNKLKRLSEDTIINHFRDKFIISGKFNNFNMFQQIERFATISIH